MAGRVKRFFRDSIGQSGVVLAGVAASASALTTVDGLEYLAFPAAGAAAIGAGVQAVRGFRAGRKAHAVRLKDLLVDYPPKRASQIDQQRDVGIDPSPIADKYRNDGQWPPYIGRDADTALDDALASERFVVVHGPSKAGKSRAAFAAVRRMADDPYVAIVKRSGSVGDLVATDDSWLSDGPVVLWLDKVDGFLNGGFTGAVRDRIRNESDVTIVGTIEDQAWQRFREARDAYDAADVLASARAVQVQRANASELAEAARIYPDEQFQLGIGEHFVSAQLLREYYDAADNDRRAVLHAVVDWQRTGMPSSVRHRDLKRLCRLYLNGADPGRWLDEGITWANEAVKTGARLLEVEGSGRRRRYKTADHIVAYVARHAEPVPDEVWQTAIDAADGEESLGVGQRAADGKRWDDAIVALTRAERHFPEGSSEHGAAAARLGGVLWVRGRQDEAAVAFANGVESGSDHAHLRYGYMLLKQERFRESEEMSAPAVIRGNRTAAFNLLEAMARGGRLDHAEEVFRPAVDAGNAAAALMLGNVIHSRGDLDEAERLYQAAELGARKIDRDHAKRAQMLRALIAEQRDQHEEADELYRESWDEEQWKETLDRLELVGLGELDDLRTRTVARRTGLG